MNLVQAIEQDVEAKWGKVEDLVVEETKAAWNTVKKAFLAIQPSQWQQLLSVLESAGLQAFTHDYAGALQQLEMYAETNAIPWIKDVDEDVLVAAIAAWKASKL